RTRRPRSATVTAAMISACVAIGAAGFAWSRYAAPRFLPVVTGLAPLAVAPTPLPPIARRGLLLGDSHAAALSSPFADYARRNGAELTTKFKYSCPPLLGVDVINPFGERVTACNDYFANVDFSGVDFAIVSARWNFYLGLPWSDPYYQPFELAAELSGETVPPSALMRRALTALVAKARQAGVRRILLVGPTPEFPVHAPYCVVRALRLGVDTCTIARATVDTRRAGA